MNTTVQLQERTGKAAAQRRNGYVPVVVYGTGTDTLSLKAEAKTINDILNKNPRAILKAKLPSGTKDVIIQEVQRQPLSNTLLHVDFQAIDLKAELDTKVALTFTGDSVGVRAGGIQTVEMYELDIRTLPDNLESTFEVDISGLDVGDQLLVSDLPEHEGWTVLNDPDSLVVKIAPPIVAELPEDEAEEATAPETEEAAAPDEAEE